MARNRQSQPRSKNERNNRQQTPKKNSRRQGGIEDPQEIRRTADRSGNRKGISSPGRRTAAREDDERNP